MKITWYQSSTTKTYIELLYAFEICIFTLNETFILVFWKLIFCDQYKFEITLFPFHSIVMLAQKRSTLFSLCHEMT